MATPSKFFPIIFSKNSFILLSCKNSNTLKFFREKKLLHSFSTTEHSESTERCSFSLCTLCPLWFFKSGDNNKFLKISIKSRIWSTKLPLTIIAKIFGTFYIWSIPHPILTVPSFIHTNLCALCGAFLIKKQLMHIYAILKVHNFDLQRQNTSGKRCMDE